MTSFVSFVALGTIVNFLIAFVNDRLCSWSDIPDFVCTLFVVAQAVRVSVAFLTASISTNKLLLDDAILQFCSVVVFI